MATFYDIHKNDDTIYGAMPAILMLMVIDTVGIIANSLVIVITIYSK